MYCSSNITPQQMACTSYKHCDESFRAQCIVLFYLAVSTESNVLEGACSKSSNVKIHSQVSVEKSVLVFDSSHHTGKDWSVYVAVQLRPSLFT